MNMYFDSAATTPLDPKVKEAMIATMDVWGNENSKHSMGRTAQKKIDEYLEQIAGELSVSRDQLAITYSGTDANRRVLWACRNRFGHENLYTSSVEHSSILDEVLEKNTFDPRSPHTLPTKAKLAALMQANSETGALYDLQPFRKKFPETLLLQDCAQSFPKGYKPDFENADFVSFAPQKFHGPKMIGLLYIKHPEHFPEISKDSHTKNVFLVAGMAKAFEILQREKNEIETKMKQWTEEIELFVAQNIPDYKIHEHNKNRVPGIINIAFKGIRGSELMTILSQQENVCVSTGSACTSDILSPTHVIRFIEPNPQWQYPIRISLNKFLTDDHIKDFCEILAHYVEEMRKELT